MYFWIRKKETESKAFKEALKMMDLLDAKVSKCEMEIEMMKLKAKKKVYKELGQETEGSPTEKPIYNDGFDEIRKINKDG